MYRSGTKTPTAQTIEIIGCVLNDLPFRRGGAERPLNAERSWSFSLNGFRVSTLKTLRKHLNDYRSELRKSKAPFTPPPFFKGVRFEDERS